MNKLEDYSVNSQILHEMHYDAVVVGVQKRMIANGFESLCGTAVDIGIDHIEFDFAATEIDLVLRQPVQCFDHGNIADDADASVVVVHIEHDWEHVEEVYHKLVDFDYDPHTLVKPAVSVPHEIYLPHYEDDFVEMHGVVVDDADFRAVTHFVLGVGVAAARDGSDTSCQKDS